MERVNGGAESIYRQDFNHMVLPKQSKEVIGKPGTVVFAGRRAESPAARIVKRRSSSALDSCRRGPVGAHGNSLPNLTGYADVAPEMSQREELIDPSFYQNNTPTFHRG